MKGPNVTGWNTYWLKMSLKIDSSNTTDSLSWVSQSDNCLVTSGEKNDGGGDDEGNLPREDRTSCGLAQRDRR